MLLQRSWKPISSASLALVRNLSNKTCIFTRIRRADYLRHYPTVVVQPNGSTYNIRYEDPRAIIKLPLDISTLSEEERLIILENRKPKQKVKYQREEAIDFDPSVYVKYIKKK